MNRLCVGAPRAALFLGLGGALVAGTSITASGCRTAEAAEQGVFVKVSEVAPGRFVIDDETVVEGPTKVQVTYLDSRRVTLDSPEQFERLLAPLDTLRAYDERPEVRAALKPGTPLPGASLPGTPLPGFGSAASDSLDPKAAARTAYDPKATVSGGGGSWDAGAAPEIGDAPRTDDGQAWNVSPALVGLPLGVLLGHTMAMPLWHPPAYSSYANRSGTPLAYRSPVVRDSAQRRRGSMAGLIFLGRMPFGARQAATWRGGVPSSGRARATTPSGGRGGFGRGWTGGGG